MHLYEGKIRREIMYKVLKRDGSIVLFDITKISKAIGKAFKSVNREADQVQLHRTARRGRIRQLLHQLRP